MLPPQRCHIEKTMQSWRCRLNDAVSPSQRHRLDDAIWTIQSQQHRLDNAVWMIQSQWCRLDAAVSMLPSRRCCLDAAVSTLPSRRCRLDAAVSMLPSRCCRLDAVLLTRRWLSRHCHVATSTHLQTENGNTWYVMWNYSILYLKNQGKLLAVKWSTIIGLNFSLSRN